MLDHCTARGHHSDEGDPRRPPGTSTAIILLAILFVTGALTCVLAPNLEVTVVGRSGLGLAVGGASVVVPVLLSELAPYEIRGSGR